jgi:hypothetical protein
LPYIRAKGSDLYDDLGGNVSADLEEDAMGSSQAGLQADQVGARLPWVWTLLDYDRARRDG